MLKNALENITVLDFSVLLPGPLATKTLGDMGAKVIKIENKHKNDPVRNFPPGASPEKSLFHLLNKEKDVLLLDFNEDLNIIYELVRSSNVLIEQFRPGRMKKWQLDYESLKKINPDLIYISLSGFGQKGPYAHLAGHDLNFLAISGFLDLNRDENGKPVIPGAQLADVAGGTHALLIACLAALIKGEGQYLDVSMTDGMPSLMAIAYNQFLNNIPVNAFKILNGDLVNYNLYETADNKWIALAALELKFWNKFCQVSNKGHWQRDDLAQLAVHVFPQEEIKQYFKSADRTHWETLYKDYDICFSPVLEWEELIQHPYHQFRNYFKEDNQLNLPWI